MLSAKSVSIQRVWMPSASSEVKSGDSSTARWKGSTVATPVIAHFGEGAAGAAQRMLAVRAGDDQLGEQGVELRRHEGAGADAGVQPDARARWGR